MGKVIVKQIVILTVLVILILVLGISYYHFFEGLSIVDAFFFTTITISTVGYNLPDNLSTIGKIVTSIMIFSGISVVLYGVTTITAIIVEGKLRDFLKRRKIEKMIEKLKDHVIVVGAGKTGEYVIGELINEREKFVIIDNDEERINKVLNIYKDTTIPFVLGDATEEETLINAGVKKAKALITTLPEDSVNVFVVLSARTLNSDLTIISKVTDTSSIQKLKYAGATTVVAADQIAGTRMARLTTRPHAVNFLDIVAFGNESYRIEELEVVRESYIVDKTIGELNLAKNFNIMVLGINREGSILFAPTGDSIIRANDKLIILGSQESIEQFREFAKL
ncbi:potassium channel family protein [Thermosipho atlanticus]|uniref:potassium channel family protein n=1 Tax=Thermosipho atlanticus TaxID=238991 RepID=UPI001F4307DE|nr:potassium channel protein [Thermosipho atlanticus]